MLSQLGVLEKVKMSSVLSRGWEIQHRYMQIYT